MSFFRLVIVSTVLLLLGAGCKRVVISSQNIDRYQHDVVQADTLYSITMPELYDLLLHSKLIPHGGTLERLEVKQFLDSVVCDTLTGFAANEIKLEDHYFYYRMFRRPYYDLLIKEWLRKTVYDKIELDSTEVVKYYYNNPDVFSVEEKTLLYHILVTGLGLKYSSDSLYYRSISPEKLEEETAEYAWRLYKLLDFGEDFKEVSYLYSHDNLAKSRRGWLGWVARGVYKHPFDSVAFSLKPGEYSKPYRDEDGWHIVYVKDYQSEGLPDFDSVQYRLAWNGLMGERANKLAQPLVDSLAGEINLEFHEEVLDTNVYFVDRQQWAAIVNGVDSIDFTDLRSWEEATRKKYKVANTTIEMKKEILRRLAKRIVAIQAARAAGIDTLPYVKAEEERMRHKQCKALVRKGWTDIGWFPSDSMVEVYFQKHIDEFKPEKPLKVQHIITQDSVLGEFIRDQAMAGNDFLELANEYYPGEESIRRDLANLGDVGPEDVPPAFFKAAMSIQIGDVTHPIKTEYGYHIIKVLERFGEPDMNQARSKIAPILKKLHAMEVFRNYRDELYRRYQVRFPGSLYPIHLKPLEYRTD
ncbi:MAG: hypothetical protein DRP47_12375 [Candidatus Zixiibacteriota bacterium]|nr:MAG: hypothetical protein DRP47_12375 [candidate division Zixibacteria bacterium]